MPAPSSKAVEVALVTLGSPLGEKVDLVMSLFRGRADVYAEGYEGGDTAPLAYPRRDDCSLRFVMIMCA